MRKVGVLLLAFLLFGAPLRAADNFLGKGIEEFKAENYEEAVDSLKKAREQSPRSSIAAFYLGLVYKQMGQYRDAAQHFRDAVTLIPPTTDAYVELIEMLYNLDELKEAKEWIARAESEKIKPSYVAFLKGLVLTKEGKGKDAITAFGRAKELDSSIAQAADFQIALLYAKERRLQEARESLKNVLAIDPNSELAAFAREYENVLTKTLQAYRAWRFTVGTGYQYDTNVISKPSADIGIPTVDAATGERDSSIFGSFRIDYIPLMSAPFSLNAQYAFYTNNYLHSPAYKNDTLVQSLSVTPAYTFSRGVLSLPIAYSHVWLNEREYMNTALVRPSLNLILLPGHIGQFSAGYGKREMLRPGDPDEDRDGEIYSLSAGYLYPFAGGNGVFNLRYEYTKEDTQGRNWDNSGDRVSASLLVPLAEKVSLILSGDAFWQRYRNVHTISGAPGFPASPERRRDDIYSGSAGLSWELYKGLRLIPQYSHTRADSNFPIYDYRRDIYSLGVEYTF